MTKRDIERIGEWFGKHHDYWFYFAMLGVVAIIGQLCMLDGLYDGGSAYEPYSWEENDPGNAGKIQGHKYPDMFPTIIGIICTAPFAFWVWTLPVNTLLLKIRRRDFFTGQQRPSKRELKMKERERQAKEAIAAVRQRETELGLEHYDFGRISR